MALDCKNILERLNNANAMEDKALASVEYLDIQRLFEDAKSDEDKLIEQIAELQDEISTLNAENQRLRDVNAEIRVKYGQTLSAPIIENVAEKIDEVAEVVEDLQSITYEDIASDF